MRIIETIISSVKNLARGSSDARRPLPRAKAEPSERGLPDPFKHVVLHGFMGSGKTTVGKLLAAKLGRKFVDTDALVVRESGKDIPEHFASEEGVRAFRELEARAIERILTGRKKPAVLALGGGALENDETGNLVSANGLNFYLFAKDPALLWERTEAERTKAERAEAERTEAERTEAKGTEAKGKEKGEEKNDPSRVRPLAKNRDEFAALFEKRIPKHERIAGARVDARKDPEDVVRDILTLLLGDRSVAFGVGTNFQTRFRSFGTTAAVFEALGEFAGKNKKILLLANAETLGDARENLFRDSIFALDSADPASFKTFEKALEIAAFLSARGFGRSDALVARGDTHLLELGSFAAGIFKRGIGVIHLPTDLLATMNSEKGTGARVNFDGAQNLLSFANPPNEVWLDAEVLTGSAARLPKPPISVTPPGEEDFPAPEKTAPVEIADGGAGDPEKKRALAIISRAASKKGKVRESRESRKSLLWTRADLDSILRNLGGSDISGKRLVILDRALAFKEKELWEKALGEDSVLIPNGSGETLKTPERVSEILKVLKDKNFSPDDWVFVRGGGSLTDLGVFAAAAYRGGTGIVLMPSTLLGAVDAAIGGKCAVNLAGVKNQLGLFRLPDEVWTEAGVLSELPGNLVREGLTEAFKTGLVLSENLANLVYENIERYLPVSRIAPESPGTDADDTDAPGLPESVPERGIDPLLAMKTAFEAAKLKIEVAKKDFRETKGARDILNFGHTFGHVMESSRLDHDQPLSHGEAVAFGMAVALRISRVLAGLPDKIAEPAVRMCLRLAGGSFPPLPDFDEALSLLMADKKIRDGKLKLALLKNVGKPVVRVIGPEDFPKFASLFSPDDDFPFPETPADKKEKAQAGKAAKSEGPGEKVPTEPAEPREKSEAVSEAAPEAVSETAATETPKPADATAEQTEPGEKSEAAAEETPVETPEADLSAASPE
ncbi:MAG: hypothetical protein LBF41_09140, partial [Deltaproteobacteria bacterium]|nr:hypothetical protein [Deltaproteobacteria bacterium]